MHFLPLDTEHLATLQAAGFRAGTIEASRYPSLTHDVATVDYSGWPIYCRTDTSDALVDQFCRALVSGRNGIAWDIGPLDQPPLPLTKMVTDSPTTPLDVPLHPRAAGFWRDLGLM